jgi:hemoglobin
LIIEVIRYTITPGQELVFEEAYRRASQPLESSSHCLGFILTRATKQRNHYIMMIYWDSPDGHLIGFRESALFKEFQEHLHPFATMIEEAGHYRKTGIELTKKQLVRISGPPRG